MDFGKLPSVDHVYFALPDEDPRTTALLDSNKPALRPRVYVGGPVWTCPKWLGKVYPKKTPQRAFLEAYAKQFNSIELNATFYRIPDSEQVRAWCSVVPADFRFAPKVYQGVSHAESLFEARKWMLAFWKSVEHFDAHLGTCFLQLPPHFDYTHWIALKQLLAHVPDPRRLAVEFRHPSWFGFGNARGTVRPDVYDVIQSLGCALVITDVAGRRDVMHSSLSSRVAFIRFVGNELHPSDFERIDAWVDRASSWIERGLEELCFFVHQPTELEVPELCRRFVDGLTQRLGPRFELSIRTWEPVTDAESLQPQLSLL